MAVTTVCIANNSRGTMNIFQRTFFPGIEFLGNSINSIYHSETKNILILKFIRAIYYKSH